ncbi:energy-coupling factor ABC transporter ATP-binding protein [bacterium]|nr:energy-coupling factor ABC transporter ATP-binding protein [bacterium]MBU1637972.1 energy-coupling factor ABC transporter ATP-binding protein [bacterium]MBU1920930.1 energy-coupling factor ABC transporter ATP-binding protein [bacterium]
MKKLILSSISYSWESRQGKVAALNNLDLELQSGSPYLICGRSGSGKTTLGLLCAGLLKPDNGELRFSPESINSDRIAIVFQFPEALFLEDSVRKEFESIHGDAADHAAQRWLNEVGLDYSELADRLPARLSSAEGRLTAIAFQLSREPALLILDEPTIGLDSKHRRELTECLHNWIAPDRMLIIITHDLALMRALKGETCILKEGRVELRTQTEKLLHNETLLKQYEMI